MKDAKGRGGTRRFGNDPKTTIGSTSLKEARRAWTFLSSPSPHENGFRLSRRKS